MNPTRIETYPSIWKINFNNIDGINILNVPAIQENLSSGVYTSLRIYPGNKVYHFVNHIDQLAQSAQLSGFKIELSEKLMRISIRNVLEKYVAEQHLKVQILVFPGDEKAAIYLILNQLPILPEGGVKVITNKIWRNNPKAKRTDFILLSNDAKTDLSNDVNEILMVNEKGEILEGMSSNFFGLSKGVIWTAEEGVLSGTTRESVLKIIEKLKTSIFYKSFSIENIDHLDEAFITSVSRGVLPVVYINDHRIGDGKPGKTSLLIKEKFDELINNELEDL